MQLVAYGAQDIYLTGNPQITFFKVVYRRHTNFSMESIQQTFSGGGNNVVATISRNGDLVHKMYLVGTEGSAGPPIKTVELEIGGQRIDRQSGDWMDTWNELSTPESKAIGLKAMTGKIGNVSAGGNGVKQQHIPLLFWFCRNPGLALPLIALQYHEVKVKFSFDLTNTNTYTLYCDYIYLDTDERRRFAQVSHEYLIEQVQEQTATLDGKNKLNFNHPVKELIWRSSAAADTVGLKLNGHERFSTRNDEYFYLQQPFDYHTAVPHQNLPAAAQITLTHEPKLSLINQAGVLFFSITSPNGPGVYTAIGPSTSTGTIGDFNIASGVLSLGMGSLYHPNSANIDSIDGIPAGTQLAIVCSKTETSDPATGGTIGQTYFATVTATAVASTDYTNTIAIGINVPTATDVSLTLGDTGNDPVATFNVFAVTNGVSNQARTSADIAKIGVYSFALKPEEHQPSGTCNFSRIDNAELTFTGPGSMGPGVIYAVNYNVLRIMSGMGGLAYSN